MCILISIYTQTNKKTTTTYIHNGKMCFHFITLFVCSLWWMTNATTILYETYAHEKSITGNLNTNVEVQFKSHQPKPPESVCSLPCEKGQAKKYVEGESCCWHCFNCSMYQVNNMSFVFIFYFVFFFRFSFLIAGYLSFVILFG